MFSKILSLYLDYLSEMVNWPILNGALSLKRAFKAKPHLPSTFFLPQLTPSLSLSLIIPLSFSFSLFFPLSLFPSLSLSLFVAHVFKSCCTHTRWSRRDRYQRKETVCCCFIKKCCCPIPPPHTSLSFCTTLSSFPKLLF